MKLARSSEKMNELHTFGGKMMNAEIVAKNANYFSRVFKFSGKFFSFAGQFYFQHATYTGDRENELGFLVKYRLRISLKNIDSLQQDQLSFKMSLFVESCVHQSLRQSFNYCLGYRIP